ncbi:hypothetical protein CEXT_666651 [Caerostris extrusa]|uniref:Uncharacterized protein n=1 Tax=Caerostris extrusa TaxID=172846 RepID=A0AAV4YDY8_CAEEX|nr:hypothetical protein CEXT_666651 [Caerostris extrusa]
MKAEETTVQRKTKKIWSKWKSIGTQTGTSTALLPAQRQFQEQVEINIRANSVMTKVTSVPPPENEPEEQPETTPRSGNLPKDYALDILQWTARFFMHGDPLRSRRSSKSKSGNTSSDVSDIPTDVSDIPADVRSSLEENLYYEAHERQSSEESCSELRSALETQGSLDESTSASDLPLDSAPITISNLSTSTSISTDTGEEGNAAYRARCAREADMLGDPDTSSSGIASTDQSELADRNDWFQRGEDLVAEENRNVLPPEDLEPSEEEDLGQRDAVLALEQWMQSGPHVLAENPIEKNLNNEPIESEGSGTSIYPPVIPPRWLITDSIEQASTSSEDLSRSRSVERQAGPSKSKKKRWQKRGQLRSLQKSLETSMVSTEEEIDSSKQAAKAIEEDSNPHPADDGLKESSSGMESLVDSERAKSDLSASLPMEVETRGIYAPSTSKQGLETCSHSKASTKRGKKSRAFNKESAKTKYSLPSPTKSKQESSSSKQSQQRKGKSPISQGKNPDERSTREDDDSKKEKSMSKNNLDVVF